MMWSMITLIAMLYLLVSLLSAGALICAVRTASRFAAEPAPRPQSRLPQGEPALTPSMSPALTSRPVRAR
jgi:hypothetical protein